VTGAARAFPGATGVSRLDVYDWVGPDGLRGGSAHIHLASTEGYIVQSGHGSLQTLGAHGYAEVPLNPGDCLWFTPGTVHRLVNDGDLSILVVMQNAGLPEAGDAVMTFPPEVLADRDRYAASMAVTDETSARRRRDLALDGYLMLRERVLAEGPGALEDFLRAALSLVSDRADDWRSRWRAHAAAVAELTGDHLDDIAAGRPGHLLTGSLQVLPHPEGPRGFGMCGRLTVYPADAATTL
jgi:mannose-6-phosphate isomerase-like protein (cupin superfamily)